MSRSFLGCILVFALTAPLAGCAESPVESTPQATPPVTEGTPPSVPPPAEGTAGPGLGAPPADGAMRKPEELKFSRFIEPGAKTVTITVHVEGAKAGQIDIQSLVEKDGEISPTALHVEPFTGTTPVKITAPATFADPLYFSAVVKMDHAGDLPHAGPPTPSKGDVGGVSQPVKLEGKDLDVTIRMGEVPPWMEKLEKQAPKPGDAPGAGGAPPGPPPTPPT